MSRYMIAGGQEGKDRLDVQSAAYRPSTLALLQRADLETGWRCLDVGCGGGHVTIDLARLVGPTGWTVGIDSDEVIIDLARADADRQGVENAEFRVGRAEDLDETGFQLAYTRLMLDVVTDPRAVLSSMVGAVVRGGVVVAEEPEVGSCFCYPPNVAFHRWIGWFAETMRRRGGDPDIGPRLPELFRSVGLEDIGLDIVHLAWMGGPHKWLHWMTMDAVRDAVLAEGVATASQFDDVRHEIRALTEDPYTILAGARLFQVWGYRR